MNKIYTIQKVRISFTLIATLFFIFGSGVTNADAKRKPKWITERPVDNNYYIGVGKSSKTNADYIQTAKSNALADMISEISVNISTNSVLSQFEDNSGLKETYKAQIKLATKDYIEGYELVESWEDKNEYWVYYKLSKTEYQRRKQEILDHAKNLSKDFYEKAKEAEKEYDINNTLIYYVHAFDAIKKHIGEDLSVFTFDGRIYLDNAIYQSIQDIFSRIRIVPGEDLFVIKALSSNNDPVFVKVKLKTDLETQNIANIPITFSFPGLNIRRTENVVSQNNGNAECTFASMAPKGRTQIIKAELNTDVYFGGDAPDNLLKNLFNERGITPYGNINIEVKELFAYIESEEINQGNRSSIQPITQFLKDELSKSFFSFTENIEQADVVIKIEAKIINGTKLDKHNLHTAFLNCNISILDTKNNLIIFNDAINIKGMGSGSYGAAIKDALKKVRKRIIDETLPNIRKIKL